MVVGAKRKKKSLRSVYQKRRKTDSYNIWDFTLPGYNYLGPGNSLDKGPPTNPSDAAALKHDKDYDDIEKAGYNPYIWYSDADDEFLENVENDWGGLLGQAWFLPKKALATIGALPTVPKGVKKDKQEEKIGFADTPVSNLVATSDDDPPQQMSETTGSGNAAGLKETPIDKPRNISRGPPDSAHATLPYYFDRVTAASRWSQDETFRMTSPYDCHVTRDTNGDLNAGAGTATYSIAVASDATDSNQSPARWYDFYSTLYNYYHVMSCRWSAVIENLSGEPLWVHQMYYNDEAPPPGATNEDIQCWNDAKSYYLGSYQNTVTAATGVIKHGQIVDNELNVEGATSTGSNLNVDTGNYISNAAKGGFSPVLRISGSYKPGQKKRQIYLDSEVENWTAIDANPALPERLLLRFKPYWNALDTNNTTTYDRTVTYRVAIKLEYLVQFKELKYGLRWPVERQPVTAAIVTNLEEDDEPTV